MNTKGVVAKKASACNDEGNDVRNQEEESCNCLKGLPGAEIKAFLDVGHGMGSQCLQAGWSLGVPSRGVELLPDHHTISECIQRGFFENLRPDPHDWPN